MRCRPTRYAVIIRPDLIIYGFRCSSCGVPSKRYSTRELREERLKLHVKKGRE